MLENEATILTRHGDKGSWVINETELRARVPERQANLILGVLQHQFTDMTETPLRLDGLVRSIRLGDEIFDATEGRAVVVSINSGKPRAELTNAIATVRIAEREQGQEKKAVPPKRIDMLQIEDTDLVRLLADTDDSTWGPYAQMMKDEGITEAEAIMRWLHDLNAQPEKVGTEVHPHEGADRYRHLIRLIHEKLKIGKDQSTNRDIPLILFGVGHSGSLGQIRHEDLGEIQSPEDTPDFCEMYKFDETGRLTGTQRVNL